MTKLSIVIPVYNAEIFIKRFINKILEQTFQDFELILIDDGSIDSSKEFIESFFDKRIKYFYQENKGPSSARNLGIDKAQGEYVVFFDSDDFLSSHTVLEDYVKNMDNKTLKVCSFIRSSEQSNLQKKDIGRILNNEETLENNLDTFYLLVKKAQLNNLWTKTYSLEIIKENKIRFNDSVTMGEDMIFNIDYLEFVEKIVTNNNKNYVYNDENENSLTKRYHKNLYDMYQEVYKAIENYHNKISSKNKDSEYYRFLFNMIVSTMLTLEIRYSSKTLNELHHYVGSVINTEMVNNIIDKCQPELMGKKEKIRFCLLKSNKIWSYIALEKGIDYAKKSLLKNPIL